MEQGISQKTRKKFLFDKNKIESDRKQDKIDHQKGNTVDFARLQDAIGRVGGLHRGVK